MTLEYIGVGLAIFTVSSEVLLSDAISNMLNMESGQVKYFHILIKKLLDPDKAKNSGGPGDPEHSLSY